MTNNQKKKEDHMSNKIRSAFSTFMNRDKSPEKCCVQKYAQSALEGLKKDRPPGNVGA